MTSAAVASGGPHGHNVKPLCRNIDDLSICSQNPDTLYPSHEWMDLERGQEDGANIRCSRCHLRALADEDHVHEVEEPIGDREVVVVVRLEMVVSLSAQDLPIWDAEEMQDILAENLDERLANAGTRDYFCDDDWDVIDCYDGTVRMEERRQQIETARVAAPKELS